MNRIFIAIILSLAMATCFAQGKTFGSPAEVRKFTDGLMGSIGAGKYENAWKQLRPASLLPGAEIDAFTAQFASQQPNIALRYGKPTGYEYIRDQQVGTALIRFQYIAKFERSPMRWLFIFYRTDTGWVMTDFKFDGNVNALFTPEG
ncbi:MULTISPECIES: hypothetical protein [unclassified Rhizobacter]|uniref:hypothetical protein n=1 Tax=unclassified Rhizobacter TaxID=2640088 RepID=UPI00070127B2|nr:MULTISPECIES: hypothetical protein [unclassified Rhizobacter]KQU67884.1 hypothetical protein ASC88_07955 [Rhizobacter sp. Root29]KQW15229.1 hypothetical protein ASC98_13960 [Rhizobacter sp. Root1238]KRB24393.1 hypothetical protein ASE08_17945 [Rhizobacter sp. Root16D2]